MPQGWRAGLVDKCVGSQSRINNNCRIKVEHEKPENDVEFDEIVRFLVAQKAVMEYAGLN